MTRLMARFLFRRLVSVESALPRVGLIEPPTWPGSIVSWRLIGTNSCAMARSDDGGAEILGGPRRGRSGDRDVPENISAEDIQSEPMIYSFTGMPPDETASRLADASKEDMWRMHQQDPNLWTVDRLAKEYRIRKQRVHAILWLKDIERQMEKENGGKLDDEIEKMVEESDRTFTRAAGERHWSMNRESNPLLSEEENMKKWEEASAKEEEMKVAEFEQKMKFNKRAIAGEIMEKKEDRRRPPGGWSYLVEELGEEGRRGRGGGIRFVAGPDGTRRGLNDLEKDFLRREKVRPRRQIVPR